MKPSKVIVTPVDGKTVRDPSTMEPLPPEGRLVDNISYWQRRAKDKDVVMTLPPKPMRENARDKEAKQAKTKQE
jgi:hypothetical protein